MSCHIRAEHALKTAEKDIPLMQNVELISFFEVLKTEMQCSNILSHCVSTLSFKYPQNILYFGHFSALFTVTDSKEFFSEDLKSY